MSVLSLEDVSGFNDSESLLFLVSLASLTPADGRESITHASVAAALLLQLNDSDALLLAGTVARSFDGMHLLWALAEMRGFRKSVEPDYVLDSVLTLPFGQVYIDELFGHMWQSGSSSGSLFLSLVSHSKNTGVLKSLCGPFADRFCPLAAAARLRLDSLSHQL